MKWFNVLSPWVVVVGLAAGCASAPKPITTHTEKMEEIKTLVLQRKFKQALKTSKLLPALVQYHNGEMQYYYSGGSSGRTEKYALRIERGLIQKYILEVAKYYKSAFVNCKKKGRESAGSSASKSELMREVSNCLNHHDIEVENYFGKREYGARDVVVDTGPIMSFTTCVEGKSDKPQCHPFGWTEEVLLSQVLKGGASHIGELAERERQNETDIANQKYANEQKRKERYRNSPKGIADRICSTMELQAQVVEGLKEEERITAMTGVSNNTRKYQQGQALLRLGREIARDIDSYRKKSKKKWNPALCKNR